MTGNLKVGVVGACGTGKSELVTRLKRRGIDSHHIAQEHSFTPHMWQIVTNPDILIYLKVSFTVSMERKDFNLTPEEFNEQLQRLSHAEAHADIIIDTDSLAPNEVFENVMKNLLEM